jgi:hypothetical protein
MATDRIKSLANKALPYLIHCAQKRQTVTYGELGEFLQIHPHAEVPHILTYIRDQICEPLGYPRLTAIVISKNSKRVRDGFFKEDIAGLSEDEIQQKYEQFRDVTFSFPRWDDLLDQLGLKPLPATDQDLDREAEEYNQVMERSGGGSGGEQVQHQLLKEYIATYPQKICISALGNPTIEYEFISADRCDILIELVGERSAIIEIKIGQRGELVKGIYQLVKYGALLEAERGHGEPYPVELHLVAYSIPPDISDFAKKFGITCHCIPEDQVPI